MEITTIDSGTYVLAVSGGVDSVVLLDLLFAQKGLNLIVAHFDHGIRKESEKDRKFVHKLSTKYGLKFEYAREELGFGASEQLARERRYAFLNMVLDKYSAKAIITAHHKDDLIETALINISRGTNRSGISSLKSTSKIIRPMLELEKSEIINYALSNNLTWCEDSTNKSDRYLRNRVRKLVEKSDDKSKKSIEKTIKELAVKNSEIDSLLEEVFEYGFDGENFSRNFFISLPYEIQKEIIVFWLKKINQKYDKKLVEKVVNHIKTNSSNTKIDISKNYFLTIGKKQISLEAK